ncbi:MAG: LegC family aminotransferase [Trueperaceae bacterium]|nr:LegC family aminotransferase [Trueperaceae bacterium]
MRSKPNEQDQGSSAGAGANTELSIAVTEALRRALGEPSGTVPLHEPRFAGNEWAYLRDCLDSTFVSSVGPYVDRFERDLEALTGARRAVALVNGTAALHVALLLAGVRPGDEVLVPAFTFVATVNAVSYCGATPHFVDIEERTLGLDARRLDAYLKEIAVERAGSLVNRASGRPIRALVPMHTFGHPSDLEGLVGVADRYGLALVEDAAEGLGSTYRGRHVGTFGLLGVLSFNGNKTITTGGGGAILTNDEELAARAKHLTTTAKLPHRWAYRHDQVGFNYRMPNINAALGCAQLEQLPAFLSAKRRLLDRYLAAFEGIPGVKIFEEPAEASSNYWLHALLLDDPEAKAQDAILAATNEAGLGTRPPWTPMHMLEPYAGCPRMDLTVTETLSRKIVNLPSGPGLAIVGEDGVERAAGE